jgi:hypothetical protein
MEIMELNMYIFHYYKNGCGNHGWPPHSDWDILVFAVVSHNLSPHNGEPVLK